MTLAAAIRVLVHDTTNSRSLMGQLGRQNMLFLDTSAPRDPNTVLTYTGISAMDVTPQGPRYVAALDELPPAFSGRYVGFDQWWNTVIFVDEAKRETTRKDLILAVANKDGGAHVDPVLDEKYACLSRRNSLAWRYCGPNGDLPLDGPQLAAARQIAHEVLRSFNPMMPKARPRVQGTLFVNVRASVGDKRVRVPKVGRNEPCPCGSGKKYKKCHGTT